MITFALVVTLLYPGGVLKTVMLGTGMTAERCAAEARRAHLQLSTILSVASIQRIACVPERQT